MDNQHIRLLDCTLRDGGHINQGQFGEMAIKNTIANLVDAGIDIIEVGFLWDKEYGKDTSRYFTIADVKRILPRDPKHSKFSLMADFINLDHLEPYDGTIEFIRLSFKRFRLDWGLETAKKLMDKGYKVFINPVNCNVYSDKEYLEVLEKVNELHPYGFAIVDTFGVMRVSDLSHRYYLVENNLLPDITIGLHLHENLGLAYSLGQHFAQIAKPTRKIVIDCSLLGMGRVPGNLSTEKIVDFLNCQYGKEYATEPIFDAIDDYIAPIKEQHPWGYAIPYALSAKYNLHRTYAEHLMGKQRLKIKDIQRILSQISSAEAEMFNEEYIESLYHSYMNVEYNDEHDIQGLKEALFNYQEIVIVAPGPSLKNAEQKIIEMKKSSSTCVISVNFSPNFVDSDYIFLTNTKRLDAIKDRTENCKLIITSNLLRDINYHNYAFSYNEFVYYNEKFCDDSTLMLINVLAKIGLNSISVAGFDGHNNGKLEFVDKLFANRESAETNDNIVSEVLNNNMLGVKINFISPSKYNKIDGNC